MRIDLRRKRLRVTPRLQSSLAPTGATLQGLIVDGYAPGQLIEDLRKYQSELEIQNKALRYSQQEAEAASERFAILFSNVPLALMVVDESGQVLASNSMALRLFQPLESDPPLHFLLPFVSDSDTDAVGAAFTRAKLHGTSELNEIVFKAGLGNTFTGDLHMARIENPQDELAHFICAVIDQGPLLMQRRALEESANVLRQRNEDLLLSENRKAAIINSSLDAIVCMDENQRITVFNPAAMALFECPSEQALGRAIGDFFPQLGDLLSAGAPGAQALIGEMEARTLQGKPVFVEVSIAREEHQDSTEVVTTVFTRDLTARKLAEAQRSALESQLRASQKMQAVGTMAGGIAHDFNNILSAILGNVRLAMMDSNAQSQAYTSLQEIDKAGRRARDLVQQILTFSRNERPRRSVINLADVLQETARLVRVTLPPTVDFEIREHPDCPPVMANAIQVEQAILNLCTNAILALGQDRGRVTVELESTALDALAARALGLEPGQFVALRVSDSGKGMDAATLDRIFEPFFTTRQVGQGTGLGLPVVHGIMQAHEGAVAVRSSPGHGSTFTLYFPSTLVAPDSKPEQSQPVAEIRGDNHHVMYVDDDQALVFLVQRLLTRRGFRVSAFTSPHEALETLSANPAAFDLLVTDYNMPGFSGIELLRASKRIRSDLPVALASGYVTPEIEATAMREGASALIHKPNDVDELCETVQRLTTQSPRT